MTRVVESSRNSGRMEEFAEVPKPRRRPKRLRAKPPPSLTLDLILEWADENHRRIGRWPTSLSGKVFGTLNEKWVNLDHALRRGYRGLEPGLSLSRLLVKFRRVNNKPVRPKLTTRQILAWADLHNARTGRWPLAR